MQLRARGWGGVPGGSVALYPCRQRFFTHRRILKMAKSTRLTKLKAVERQLRSAIKSCESKELASLVRQYRETLKDIEEIEGGTDETDAIAAILTERDADGKPGAVR